MGEPEVVSFDAPGENESHLSDDYPAIEHLFEVVRKDKLSSELGATKGKQTVQDDLNLEELDELPMLDPAAAAKSEKYVAGEVCDKCHAILSPSKGPHQCSTPDEAPLSDLNAVRHDGAM